MQQKITIQRQVIRIVFLLAPVLIFWAFNAQNIPMHFPLIIGCIVFPFVVKVEEKKGGFRFLVLAILSGIILLFFRSSSLYYFFSIFILLFVLDNWWGRLNYLPLFLALIVSPVLNHIVYTWSFPIRLQLSEWAGEVLRWIGMNIKIHGNVLTLDGHTFSVDPACIGLKMVITSLVFGVLILAFFEKKYKSQLSLSNAVFLLSSIFLGAILANFVRLLMLIIFHILPENWMHDVVGLMSLFFYVLLPFYFFAKVIFEKNIKTESQNQNIPQTKTQLKYLALFFVVICLQIFNGQQFLDKPIASIQTFEQINLDGFEKQITKDGVLKFQNQEVLIYMGIHQCSDKKVKHLNNNYITTFAIP